jgi:polyisoprenyl-phosphate glycosyltransferase
MMRPDRPLISVVLSFRNEADNIPILIERLEAMLAGENVEYEIVFVNDASTDASLSLLLGERQRNPRVKIVNMSRRFGVAEGVIAGMATSRGDAVVYMDSDLQDPPEVIPRLIERWRQGADIVHTVRTRRHGENALKMAATRLAYRLIQFGSSIELPVDAGDFKLLSRPAVDHLLRLRESDPYLRGLVVWLGFNQVCIPYERDSRHAGRTHFPFFSRNPWKTFTTGLTSFSFMPIYVCFALAAAGLAAALLLALAGSPFIATLTFFWATTIGAVAVIGTYLIRVYKDVRGRPAYIIESVIGNEPRAVRGDGAPQASGAEREEGAPATNNEDTVAGSRPR